MFTNCFNYFQKNFSPLPSPKMDGVSQLSDETLASQMQRSIRRVIPMMQEVNELQMSINRAVHQRRPDQRWNIRQWSRSLGRWRSKLGPFITLRGKWRLQMHLSSGIFKTRRSAMAKIISQLNRMTTRSSVAGGRDDVKTRTINSGGIQPVNVSIAIAMSAMDVETALMDLIETALVSYGRS